MRPDFGSLVAARFNASPIPRITIRCTGDRTKGQRFDVSGSWFRVVSCDVAARIGLNNAGEDQSIPVYPGIVVKGYFGSLYLFHDNYAFTGSTQGPFIVIEIGAGAEVINDSDVTPVKSPVPYLVAAQTNAGFTHQIAMMPGATFLDVVSYLKLTMAAAGAFSIAYEVDFYDFNGALINGPTFARNNRNYNVTNPTVKRQTPGGGATGTNPGIVTYEARYRVPNTADYAELRVTVLTTGGSITAYVEQKHGYHLS